MLGRGLGARARVRVKVRVGVPSEGKSSSCSLRPISMVRGRVSARVTDGCHSNSQQTTAVLSQQQNSIAVVSNDCIATHGCQGYQSTQSPAHYGGVGQTMPTFVMNLGTLRDQRSTYVSPLKE